MVDVVDKATRSRMMAGIKGKNTKPELTIRKGLHRLGFRFRLHDRHLPGKPDLIFPGRKAAVFVNGCFWHGHDCPRFKIPTSRAEFWINKINANRARDLKVGVALAAAGWRQAIVWECALSGRGRLDPDRVFADLARWLDGKRRLLELSGFCR
jgi:DNA mismatch endonuclease (patch repair protein)